MSNEFLKSSTFIPLQIDHNDSDYELKQKLMDLSTYVLSLAEDQIRTQETIIEKIITVESDGSYSYGVDAADIYEVYPGLDFSTAHLTAEDGEIVTDFGMMGTSGSVSTGSGQQIFLMEFDKTQLTAGQEITLRFEITLSNADLASGDLEHNFGIVNLAITGTESIGTYLVASSNRMIDPYVAGGTHHYLAVLHLSAEEVDTVLATPEYSLGYKINYHNSGQAVFDYTYSLGRGTITTQQEVDWIIQYKLQSTDDVLYTEATGSSVAGNLSFNLEVDGGIGGIYTDDGQKRFTVTPNYTPVIGKNFTVEFRVGYMATATNRPYDYTTIRSIIEVGAGTSTIFDSDDFGLYCENGAPIYTDKKYQITFFNVDAQFVANWNNGTAYARLVGMVPEMPPVETEPTYNTTLEATGIYANVIESKLLASGEIQTKGIKAERILDWEPTFQDTLDVSRIIQSGWTFSEPVKTLQGLKFVDDPTGTLTFQSSDLYLGTNVLWSERNFDPASKSDVGHTHPGTEIILDTTQFHFRLGVADWNVQSALVTLEAPITWNEVVGRPAFFPPSAHTHAISEITNLQTELDGKANLAGENTFSDLNTFATIYTGGARIIGSSATFQNKGFMRTGTIYLHEGSDPAEENKGLDNLAGVLRWDGDVIWHEGNDGAGSGLDADLLDGLDSSSFALASDTARYHPLNGLSHQNLPIQDFGAYDPAVTQYFLLCPYAGGNDFIGTFIISRTSGNHQAAIVDVVVSSNNTDLKCATLRTIQGIQDDEVYKVKRITYNGNDWIAVEYTGNGYPSTQPATFSGFIRSTDSANSWKVADPALVSDVFDIVVPRSRHQIDGNDIFHAGNNYSSTEIDDLIAAGGGGGDFNLTESLVAADGDISFYQWSITPSFTTLAQGLALIPTPVGPYWPNPGDGRKVTLRFGDDYTGNYGGHFGFDAITVNKLDVQVEGRIGGDTIWHGGNLVSPVENFVDTTNVKAIPLPKGGYYNTNTSTVTGAIKITLPVSWTNSMMKFTVSVFNYLANTSFDVHIAGYNYSAGYWSNPTAYIVGKNDTDSNFTVRFGHDGAKCCVYIGETDTAWKYPQVIVRDFFGGYSTNSDFTEGWNVSFQTAFGAISQVITNTQVNNLVIERSAITYGVGGLQWTDISGNGGSGLNGASPENPYSDWFHHIVANHANGAGYYFDLALPFHQDEIYFRRVESGTKRDFRKLWHDGNFTPSDYLLTTGKAADANKLDNINSSQFLRSDTSDTFTGSELSIDKLKSFRFIGANDASWNFSGNVYIKHDSVGSSGVNDFTLKVTNPISATYDAELKLVSRLNSSKLTFNDHEVWHAGNDGSGSGLDADLLDGKNSSESDTGNTMAARNSSGDIYARLFRSTYGNQSTISGGLVFRVNNSSDNYLRTCSSTAAIRAWLNVGGATEVGDYCFAQQPANYVSGTGSLISGGQLRAGNTTSNVGGSLPGTWRIMGYAGTSYTDRTRTLYARVS